MNRIKFILILMMCVFITGCQQDGLIILDETENAESESQTGDDFAQDEIEKEDASSEEAMIYVYVCGHVKNPGVYEFPAASRICEGLERAGGGTEDANLLALPQAQPMTDGMTLYVPGIDEEISTSGTTQDDGRVNINTADRNTLMTIPGIGESKADTIIAYREEQGVFHDVEDLMNIPGIKEGIFNKMKDYIKVTD